MWSYLITVNTSLADPTINTTVRNGIGGDGTTSWFVRKSLPDSWNATAQISAAVGMTVLGSSTTASPAAVSSATSVRQLLTLHPGETVSIVTAVHTSIDAATVSNNGVRPPAPWKQHDPLPLTLSYLNSLRNQSTAAAAMRAANTAWWSEYWSQSSISLPSEPLIEFYWHAAQYALGSSSRPGKTAPGLYGPWVTNDLPAWHGDYTMDYNQQAIYYGAHSSNRAAQTTPEVDLLMGYLPGAAGGARDLMQKFKKSCVDDDPGLTFPSHLGPYGYASAIGPSPNGDQRIRWNGEFAASVLLWEWEYTYSRSTSPRCGKQLGRCRQGLLRSGAVVRGRARKEVRQSIKTLAFSLHNFTGTDLASLPACQSISTSPASCRALRSGPTQPRENST